MHTQSADRTVSSFVYFMHTNLEVATSAVLVMKLVVPTLCIEQRVVLSCRFAEWKVQRAPRVLRMAVVSQSNVKFGGKHMLLVGTTNFNTQCWNRALYR